MSTLFKSDERKEAGKYVNDLITQKMNLFVIHSKTTLAKNISGHISNYIAEPTEENQAKLTSAVLEVENSKAHDVFYKQFIKDPKRQGLIKIVTDDEKERANRSKKAAASETDAESWKDRVRSTIERYSKKTLR